MGKYRTPTPIGYKGPFKNMEDIYKDYKNTLMNKGQYKAYFSSRASYGESPRKFAKTQYSREPLSSTNLGERERKEQHNEIKPNNNPEIKTEITKEDSQKIETSQETESSQKTETSQKLEQEQTETENELSYEKLGLPYEKNLEQTDINPRNRLSPYQDKAEMRW